MSLIDTIKLIKTKIIKDNLNNSTDTIQDFYNKVLTERTIPYINNLFNNNLIGNSTTKGITDFIFLSYLLYEEVISPYDLNDFYEIYKDSLNDFVKYDMGIESEITTDDVNVYNERKYYVRNYIKRVYYKNNEFISYKNEDNLISECKKIIFTENETTLLGLLPGLSLSTEGYNLHNYFLRTNEDSSLCDYRYVRILNYILNYSILNNKSFYKTVFTDYADFDSSYTSSSINTIDPSELLRSIFNKIIARTINYDI